VQNSGDNVVQSISVGDGEADRLTSFLEAHDFAAPTKRAMLADIRKFASWFVEGNHEAFKTQRVTVRDVADFRSYLQRESRQAVSTINRSLVTLRRYFRWLVEQEHLSMNPAASVKELRRQSLAPKGLERPQVRRLLREIELRRDVRANAIMHLMLYTGCRVSDVALLELEDVVMSERSGAVTYRFGKGGKQRTCPLPLVARRAMAAYLETRPPTSPRRVVVGERGPLSDRGIRALCDKYSAVCGFKIHPHLLRHTFAHQFLADNENDVVALAQLLGHENIQTTARYCQRTDEALAEASRRVNY